MPAFQSLAATKRKHEEEEEVSRKRVSTGSRTMAGQDEAWMVQWWLAQILVPKPNIDDFLHTGGIHKPKNTKPGMEMVF